MTSKSHHEESDAVELVKVLSKHHLIRIEDFIHQHIRTFTLILNCVDDLDQISGTIYKIMADNELKKPDRVHMLQIMKSCGKLTLQPCGLQKLAPHFYCVALKSQYLLKLFADIPGMGKCT